MQYLRKTAIAQTLFLFSVLFLAFSPAEAQKRIVIFGDSLTAGYQLSPEEAYPALVQEKIKDAGFKFEVVNAGVSGDTSAGGLRRINWILRAPVDIFVLALGANDGLRGQDLEAMEDNLRQILDKVREKNPQTKIIVAGMMIPSSMGIEYSAQFAAVYPRLAEDYDAVLIPFLLDRVALQKDLNLADGIHPNAEGHKVLAETVWNYLRTIITGT